MKYRSVKIVNDVLHLYYGARCVISHGVPTKTVVDEGCLHDFPSLRELKGGLSSPQVAEELYGLYCRVKRGGQEVSISYLELVMMY